MIKPETITSLNNAINFELDNARNYGDTYNSNHEFYAVLKEEFEELKEQQEKLEQYIDAVWDEIKYNQSIKNSINVMYLISKHIMEEATQVTAVIAKEIEGTSDVE